MIGGIAEYRAAVCSKSYMSRVSPGAVGFVPTEFEVEKEKERAASSSEMKRAGYSFPPSPLLFAPSGAVLPSAVLLTNSISIYHI